VAVDVLEALEHAHRNGIVHCDLKPENILLSSGHAILSDFGIARSATKVSLKDSNRISGSPAYMSPEQAAGEQSVDGRSDVFSLACVLFELIAGKPAYTGPHDLAIIAKRFQGPAPNLNTICPSVPCGVSNAVEKALATNPDDRHPSAASFAADLVRASSNPSLPWRKGFGRSKIGRAVARLAKTAAFALSMLVPA
jgi:serine/threonine-protein kinase